MFNIDQDSISSVIKRINDTTQDYLSKGYCKWLLTHKYIEYRLILLHDLFLFKGKLVLT